MGPFSPLLTCTVVVLLHVVHRVSARRYRAAGRRSLTLAAARRPFLGLELAFDSHPENAPDAHPTQADGKGQSQLSIISHHHASYLGKPRGSCLVLSSSPLSDPRVVLNMGNPAQAKKAWEEVVTVKQQAQADLLSNFSHNDEHLKDVPALKDAPLSIKASDILDRLTRQDVPCEDLVKTFIQKLVPT